MEFVILTSNSTESIWYFIEVTVKKFSIKSILKKALEQNMLE